MSIVESILKNASKPTREERQATAIKDLRGFTLKSVIFWYLADMLVYGCYPAAGTWTYILFGYIAASWVSAIGWARSTGDGYCSSIDSTEGQGAFYLTPLVGFISFPFKAFDKVEELIKAHIA